MYVPIVYGFLPEINVFVFVFVSVRRTDGATAVLASQTLGQRTGKCESTLHTITRLASRVFISISGVN